ncbi:MAG: hypothetical protein HXX11_10605, partial [Desulfuromonadales bacterium]|nr:hypothetical protein [Desulfuromonadales bacterium]
MRVAVLFSTITFILGAWLSTADADVIIAGQTIVENTTWSPSSGPYVVLGSVTVAPGVTLTVQPGTTVLFNDLVGLYVHGSLNASGATFSRSGSDRHWLGIYLAPTAGSSVLNNCIINYAGADNYGQGLALQPHNSVWARTAL